MLSPKSPTRLSPWQVLSSSSSLMRWRWREHRLLLLVITIGMIAAVLLACMVPLFSQVMATAGLRSLLTEPPQNAELNERVQVKGLSTSALATINSTILKLRDEVDRALFLPIDETPEIQLPGLTVLSPPPTSSADTISFLADSTVRAPSHANILKGRLPASVPSVDASLEVALTPESAQKLHVDVGSTIVVALPLLIDTNTDHSQTYIPPPALAHFVHHLELHVVGLFLTKTDDPFWHLENFLSAGDEFHAKYRALISNVALLSALDKLVNRYSAGAQSPGTQIILQDTPAGKQVFDLSWYARLDTDHITVDQLDSLIENLNTLQSAFARSQSNAFFFAPPYIGPASLSGASLDIGNNPGLLTQFRSRLPVFRLPLAVLAGQLLALLVFFLCVLYELLVERQLEAIAQMRARGATLTQVVATLSIQGIVPGVLALLIGPLLALLLVIQIVPLLLSPTISSSVRVISADPWQTLRSVSGYALLMVLASLLAMALTIFGAARRHLLTSEGRRNRPLWARYHLDLVAIVIALVSYLLSISLPALGGVLDARAQILVQAPLTLLAPLFLSLAAVLLFLRLYPWLLSLLARLALRGRGAMLMLATVYSARSSWTVLRMTLLLALALAFLTFSLIFSATQDARGSDVATFEVASDFSGMIPDDALPKPLEQTIADYANIPGVLAATAGTLEDSKATRQGVGVFTQLHAIDPQTFARTISWLPQHQPASMIPLLNSLAARRDNAIKEGVVPALVDAGTATALALHPGDTFTLQLGTTLSESITCSLLATVPPLPTVTNFSKGTLFFDFQSLYTVRSNQLNDHMFLNHIWLRTGDDEHSLNTVRSALAKDPLTLENLQDRRLSEERLRRDPLILNVIGILMIAASAGLLLTFLGNLLESWWRVRSRLAQFVVLRALGSNARQIAGLLLWEQSLIYLIVLPLGGLIGLLLAFAVVPTLVFSSLPAASNGVEADTFFEIQQLLPIQMILPATLLWLLLIFLGIGLLALGLIVWTALRRSLSQELRLGEERSANDVTRDEITFAQVRSRRRRTERSSAWGGRISALLSLIGWRLRRTWGLLGLATIGIVAAIAMICMGPLLSEIAGNIGLAQGLAVQSRASSTISGNTAQGTTNLTDQLHLSIDLNLQKLSSRVVQSSESRLLQFAHQNAGDLFKSSDLFTIVVSGLNVTSPKLPTDHYETRLVSTSLAQLAPSLKLLQGYIPQDAPLANSDEIEALLTPSVADKLHLRVGATLTLTISSVMFASKTNGAVATVGRVLHLRIAGLFQLTDSTRTQEAGFELREENQVPLYPLLVSDSALLPILDRWAALAQSDGLVSPQQSFQLRWRYALNENLFTVDHLEDLHDRLQRLGSAFGVAFTTDVTPDTGNVPFPYVTQATLSSGSSGYTLPDILDQYSQQYQLLSLPLTILALQVGALMLFFMLMIVTLLIDRQTGTVAMLHSRGGSSRQVLTTLSVQAFMIGLIGLLLGPPVALFGTTIIAQHILDVNRGSGAGQPSGVADAGKAAIARFAEQPMQVLFHIGWYALAAVVIAIVAVILTSIGATRTNIISVRRDQGRSSYRPLWQRFNLDILAGVIALVGYSISLYLSSVQASLGTVTRELIAAPLSLVAPIFLIIGCLLLSLRGLTWLLRLGAWLAAKGRGSISMLTLAQMERSPQQPARMILLLALCVAFAFFTLIFAASQNQRTADISGYAAGSDFSGDLVQASDATANETIRERYSNLPAVRAVTIGMIEDGSISSLDLSTSLPAQVIAVDARTYAQTVIWHDNARQSNPATSLMPLLNWHGVITSASGIPVIIDATTATRLSLKLNDTFPLQIQEFPLDHLQATVAAIVPDIPGTVSNSSAGSSSDQPFTASILLDYSALEDFYTDRIATQAFKDAYPNFKGAQHIPLNHLWLQTRDDPAELRQLRSILANSDALRLTRLLDRRQINGQLNADPFQQDLILFLLIGAIAALSLALLGDLLSSWFHMRKRQTSFAALRALGTTSRQLAGIFLWEQGLIYGLGLLLGGLLGWLLSVTVVPVLVFSNIAAANAFSGISSSAFYSLQQALPVQIVLSPWLLLLFVSTLAACLLMLFITLRGAIQPVVTNSLRLSED